MRRMLFALPVALFALSLGAIAQEKAPAKETVWVVTYSRGGG